MNLKPLFQPRSIAVVGASVHQNQIGQQIFRRLQAEKHQVYPVNPKYKQILKQKCYPSLDQIEANVDQAIIATPAATVPRIAAQAVQKKIPVLVIISSGFSESGPAGKTLEKKLKRIIAASTTLALGPNCLGYAHPRRHLDTTFAQTRPSVGNLGIITQSGAIGSYLFDWAKNENLGFSKFISLGNRIQLSENELLSHLGEDSDTKVIGLYLESFHQPKQFLKIASQVSRSKPIIVLFGGLTQAGKVASQSHTAALSPQTEVVSTVLRQSGCLQVESLEELTDLLEIFSLEPPLTDDDLAIVTNAGGPGILATDTASQVNLDITRPYDVLGDAPAERFRQAFKVVIEDRAKDAFLIIITPQTSTQLEQTARAIVNQFKSVKKPVIVSLLGGEITRQAEKILQKNQIATIRFPQKAVKYLNYLYRYWHDRFKNPLYPQRQTRLVNLSKSKLLQLKPSLQPPLTWPKLERLCRAYRLDLVETIVASEKNLPSLIHRLGLPLVLKADPSLVAHRTEAKAVYLNLNSFSRLKKAYKKMAATYSLILAQPQLTQGHELFLGIKNEPGLPPLLTLGSGGLYTELYADVSRMFLPVNKKSILQLLNQTKIGQILQGVRGETPVNLESVIKLIINISQLVWDFPQIKLVDINPAIVSQTKTKVVDIKASLS